MKVKITVLEGTCDLASTDDNKSLKAGDEVEVDAVDISLWDTSPENIVPDSSGSVGG
jgi:hypothetical protein